MSLELSLKSVKSSCFGREFHPTFDSFKYSRSVQVVSEPPIWLNKGKGLCLWPKDGYMKMNNHDKLLKALKMVLYKI